MAENEREQMRRARAGPRYPEQCPHCARPVRRYTCVSALVGGKTRERSDPAHYHLTFAAACVGMHLHKCAACGQPFRTRDMGCNWKPPEALSPGWGMMKVSECDPKGVRLAVLPKLPEIRGQVGEEGHE